MLDVSEIVQPVGLTLMLALIVTLILVAVGTPIAWWLCRTRSPLQAPIAAVVSLPLVLPPTVLGFYLLLAFGPNGPGGLLAPLWGARTLAFSFEGLVIASVLYSLPFMVQPLRTAFEALGDEPLEAAATLGAGRWTTFFRVVVPLSRTGYLTGAILTFAHTVGEFGVVLMIGGNIPGKTKLVSMAIYDFVERLEWDKAHILAGGMVVFAFVVITAVMLLDRRVGRVVG
ncbi:MAG TPA: molybdate ABC transporter permease subunit [Devosia sp.]|jgi:molybdate transport system permease protein|uniref:molybdate ABC transporter permease subunit n=1 Tax=Devosia sp. TaxID=1871048 RepID=UPI002DDD5F6D|nr:molybdate ABC transporter permease subunit [Devosia sp.]HEV2514540.1 molybdate ABC transporter permease subunit [Devosia sp.]